MAPTESRGFGYHRVYGTPDRPIEVLEEVRTGDVVLVPHGYHGPSVAAPGYHMYYLNVMAGPGAERAWKIVDDPEHAWLRGTWDDQAVDPRSCPLHQRQEPDRGFHRTEAGREDRRHRVHRPTHGGAGDDSLPGQPVRRTRRRAHQVLRGRLRHLRTRQRRGPRPGAAAGRGRGRRSRHRTGPQVRAGPQRAGHGPHGRRLRPPEGSAADLGGHRQRRPRLDEHANGRGARNDQPAARSSAACRHLCHPCQRAGVAGAGAAVLRRRHGQRRVQAAVALLRPGVAARTAARRADRRDAGAHRSCRDRCCHGIHPPGRAGRGIRLAGIAVRRTHLACRTPATRAVGHRTRRRNRPQRTQADDRRRRWCRVLRSN